MVLVRSILAKPEIDRFNKQTCHQCAFPRLVKTRGMYSLMSVSRMIYHGGRGAYLLRDYIVLSLWKDEAVLAARTPHLFFVISSSNTLG